MFSSSIGHEFSNDWMHQADSSGKLLIKQELYQKDIYNLSLLLSRGSEVGISFIGVVGFG